MDTAQVFDTSTLAQINTDSVQQKLNRTFTDSFISMLDPDGLHLATWQMLHNDDHWRVGLLCKMQGTLHPAEVFLDMSFENWDRRKEVEVGQDTST